MTHKAKLQGLPHLRGSVERCETAVLKSLSAEDARRATALVLTSLCSTPLYDPLHRKLRNRQEKLKHNVD